LLCRAGSLPIGLEPTTRSIARRLVREMQALSGHAVLLTRIVYISWYSWERKRASCVNAGGDFSGDRWVAIFRR